jgi:hypothetical protein
MCADLVQTADCITYGFCELDTLHTSTKDLGRCFVKVRLFLPVLVLFRFYLEGVLPQNPSKIHHIRLRCVLKIL